MKRLTLVQLPVPPPSALAATGNVPLAAGCLAGAVQFHGLDRRLAVEVVPPEVTDTHGDAQLADAIARSEPDFLGVSLYLWNVERSLHLAREVKRRSPHTRVLTGGPEVSADNPFVLEQEGFDVAVAGEAEDTFAQVMERLLDEREVRGLPGVALRGEPFGPAPTVNFPLGRYPSPYSPGLVPVDPTRSTYVETVRGCRSSCTFCFYPKSGGTLRVLGVAESAAMIAGLRDRGAREVVFLDPTFNHRPDFEALLDALAEVNADRSMTFFGEVRAEGLTAQQAKKLKRAGFDKLELGLQSVNPLTLKRVKRGGSPQKVAAAAALLHDEGIALLVDLIVGLPGDSADDVRAGIEFLARHGLGDEAQVFGLSLLPGTAMRATAKADGVEFHPAPPYRVTRTATLDAETMASLLQEAEQTLSRKLDEQPRPHLVERAPHATWLGDEVRPGTRHAALWVKGRELFAQRAAVERAIDARVALDPYCTLDVVLEAERDFPLDLVDAVRARLDAAPPSYLSRAARPGGANLQRRTAIVVPQGARLSAGWLDAAREVAQVFVDQPAGEALAHAAELGDSRPGARVVGAIDSTQLTRLADTADPDAVSFASADDELRWLRRALDE